ncbi:MAG: FixH family protein [Prevotellaceae bacterium]|nr:FixH family protein [Prevotellaceae bacterium]
MPKALHIYRLLILLAVIISLIIVSCDKSNDPEPQIDPTEGLIKIQEFSAPGSLYTVTLYNETGRLQLGYTKVYFAVTDSDGKFIDNAVLSHFPEMDMGMMKHSTPRSEITRVKDKALYEAYYAFLMYSGQGEGKWLYNLKYTVGNVTDSVSNVEIDVHNVFRPDGSTQRRVIQSVVAVDGSEKRYVVTLVEPQNPKTGSNEIKAYIHERQDANTYPAVENFGLKLDPRMPSMENHSSPNNVDLTWDAANKIYSGTVNFTMTGYWKLNLILQNRQGETLYGNAVTDETPASSLYFEVEF